MVPTRPLLAPSLAAGSGLCPRALSSLIVAGMGRLGCP